MKPVLHTLICSTRPSRVGPVIANWFQSAAEAHGGFDARLVDLASFRLPVFDEPEHPRLQRYHHEHTKAWSASVAAADAFVLVLPEYNFGPPGSLINAMNYLVHEWQYKAAGFLSYGGISGGLRAVQVTKPLLSTLKVVPLTEAVVVPNFAQQISAESGFQANDLQKASATALLDELLRWTDALAGLRRPAKA